MGNAQATFGAWCTPAGAISLSMMQIQFHADQPTHADQTPRNILTAEISTALTCKSSGEESQVLLVAYSTAIRRRTAFCWKLAWPSTMLRMHTSSVSPSIQRLNRRDTLLTSPDSSPNILPSRLSCPGIAVQVTIISAGGTAATDPFKHTD